MNMNNAARIIGLAATLVCSSALQAQDCSGGATGGTDATGNQCNAANEPANSLLPSDGTLPRPTAKMDGRHAPERAALPPQPSAKITAVAIGSAAPTNRFRIAASTAAATVSTSKIQTGSESMCSGGVDGGMDASGNQCNAPAPGNANDQAILARLHAR